MMIKQADDVTIEPEAVLEHWSIIRTLARRASFRGDQARHSKGPHHQPGLRFDLPTMTGTTSSGRKYALRAEGEKGNKLVSKIIEAFDLKSADWAGITFDQVEVVEPSVAAMASPALGRARPLMTTEGSHVVVLVSLDKLDEVFYG